MGKRRERRIDEKQSVLRRRGSKITVSSESSQTKGTDAFEASGKLGKA